jgi:hypothetical protein
VLAVVLEQRRPRDIRSQITAVLDGDGQILAWTTRVGARMAGRTSRTSMSAARARTASMSWGVKDCRSKRCSQRRYPSSPSWDGATRATIGVSGDPQPAVNAAQNSS